MRRHYLDNIRWITVGLVVLYHVIFMYNGVVTAGVIGPFWEVQYQDAVQYLLHPWFMVLLFLVSGMCARYYLKDIPTGISCGKNEKASGALDDRPVRVLVDTGVFQHGIQPCV